MYENAILKITISLSPKMKHYNTASGGWSLPLCQYTEESDFH